MVQTLPSSNSSGDPAYSLTEAAALIGCARRTINRHVLAGNVSATRSPDGHWYLDEAGLARVRSMVRHQPPRAAVCTSCMLVADLLYRWDSGTAHEMAPIIGIVEGNVRKHLGHLARDRHAMRQLDGSWVLTVKGREWMAEWRKAIAAEKAGEVLAPSSMVRLEPQRAVVCTSCMRAAELLYRWDTGTVQEMAPIIGIVEGNVRKHLGHLARDRHAMRQLDGSWVLTVKGREWVDGWLKVNRARPALEFLEANYCKGVDAPG